MPLYTGANPLLLMLAQHYNNKQLAHMLELSESTISHQLRGAKFRPTTRQLETIRAALRLKLEQLAELYKLAGSTPSNPPHGHQTRRGQNPEPATCYKSLS